MNNSFKLIRSNHYCIRHASLVEAWSTKRLPFEPKDWQREFKRDLRLAITSLSARPEQVVHGIYAFPERAYVDTENILYYNVGSGAFTKAARRGLRFERSYAIPPTCPISLASRRLHYHHYSLQSLETGFKYWKRCTVLARWQTRLEKVNTNSKCAYIWYAMKKGSMWISMQIRSRPQRFGLRAILSVPKGESTRPASIVKVVFDGVIAAFHHHDGRDLQEVSQRIAGQLGKEPDEISALLSKREGTVLGQKRIVKLFGSGVQWNPADDLCLAGELVTQHGPKYGKWQLSGELFEINPIA